MTLFWIKLSSLWEHLFWRIRMLMGISYQAKLIEEITTSSFTTISPKPASTSEVIEVATDPVSSKITSDIPEEAIATSPINTVTLTTFEERIATLKSVDTLAPIPLNFQEKQNSTHHENLESAEMLAARPLYSHNADTTNFHHSEPDNKEMSNWAFILIALFIFGISIGSFFIS